MFVYNAALATLADSEFKQIVAKSYSHIKILTPFRLFHVTYRISPVIRQSFFSFQNNPKDLDPSYKTDLDLWDRLGRVKLVL